MKYLFGVVFLFFFLNLNAQKHDQIWLFGSGDEEPPFSSTRMDFNFDLPQITIDPKPMLFHANNLVSSDFDGNLMFYSNGKSIARADHRIMTNGGGINPGDHASSEGSLYVSGPQGLLTIPMPEDSTKYYILHSPYKLYIDPLNFISFALMYTIVDMKGDNGMGEVITKNETIISDSLWLGKLTATKHANGRDWWVLYNKWQTNQYYTILISPEGIEIVNIQTVGRPVNDGLAQAVFAPDGSKFAFVNGVQDSYIQIFDFDRCTGLLSNEIYMEYPKLKHNIVSPGMAISLNSQFLYFSATDTIYQYDLWSDNIPESEEVIGEFDGNRDPFHNLFFLAQLAPDGKIYFNVPNGSNYLHVIENPNKKGVSCNFNQRGIELPNRNRSSLPNNPNYRLGPLDGSSCDTLGINNEPVANFRYANEDPSDPLQVQFTDLSSYEPTSWLWAIDNLLVPQQHPNVTFPAPGIYEVCLTAKNVNSSNRICKDVPVGQTTDVEEEWERGEPIIYPNPTSNGFQIYLPDQIPLDIHIFSSTGQRVFQNQNIASGQRVDVSFLPEGIYFYKFLNEEQALVKSGKLIVRK